MISFMKALVFIIILNIDCLLVFSQKPVIDSTVYNKWPEVTTPAIANNGKYVAYNIENQPSGNRSLIIVSLLQKWTIQIDGAEQFKFSDDSRFGVFRKSNDSLGIIDLSRKVITNVPFVNSFKLVATTDGNWLGYLLHNSSNDLILRNLDTDSLKKYTNVLSYVLADNGNLV